jgi:hypothetical protein
MGLTKCFMWERRLFCSSFGWGIAFREGVFSRSPTSKAVCWCGDGGDKKFHNRDAHVTPVDSLQPVCTAIAFTLSS